MTLATMFGRGRQPRSVLEERVGFELEGREGGERSEESDAEGQSHGLRARLNLLGDDSSKETEKERPADVDHEGAQRETRVEERAHDPRHDEPGVGADESSDADEQIRKK